MNDLMTRGAFAKFSTAVAGVAIAPDLPEETLQSEFLFSIALETGPVNNVGSPGADRVVVPVSGSTLEGPNQIGTVIGPSGDGLVRRPDGSSVLDLRLILQTDDGQKIYAVARGISYTPPRGTQYARILPAFETSAAKYVWLNNIVSVGVHQLVPGKVVYRVYRIL